jgi:hypothetical protein
MSPHPIHRERALLSGRESGHDGGMAGNSKGGFWSRSNWLFDKGAALYGLLPATAIGGIMGWLASWGRVMPPVAWGAIGLAAFLAVYIGVAVARFLAVKRRIADANAQHAERIRSIAAVNPLDDQFNKVKISLQDFIRPYGEAVSGKIFTECEVFGPAVFLGWGSTLDSCTMSMGCEFIKTDGDFFVPSRTKMVFAQCHFIKCIFYDVLFIVPQSQVKIFQNGSIGDIVFVGNRPPNRPSATPAPPSQPNTAPETPQ